MNEPAQHSAAVPAIRYEEEKNETRLFRTERGESDGMTEAGQNAIFDTCFESDNHLRANGHWPRAKHFRARKPALTLYWKDGKVATGHESGCAAHGAASGPEVRQHFRDSASGGHERSHEGKRAAAEPERSVLKTVLSPAESTKRR